MSNMLEQAIIDAEALKEAAQKSAQETIIEHYADDIRSAVEKILEQDEFGLDMEGDETAELSVDAETNEVVIDEVPQAALAEEDEVVTIDLDRLEEMMNEEIEEEGDLDAAEMLSREELAEEIEGDIEIELDENVIRALLEDEEVEELEEEVASDEDTETLEEAEEDDDDDPRDDAGGGHDDYKIAQDRPDFPYKEHKQLQDDNKSLLAEQKKFQKKIQLLEGKVEKYRTLINSMKEKLEEVNLSNAKLLYQNRVLDSVSLNERQKDKIVETISNAKTVEEAKIIFETLQSAVGSASTPKPKSLNEVVTKRSSAFLPRKEEKRTDPFIERMKLLAGLNNN